MNHSMEDHRSGFLKDAVVQRDDEHLANWKRIPGGRVDMKVARACLHTVHTTRGHTATLSD